MPVTRSAAQAQASSNNLLSSSNIRLSNCEALNQVHETLRHSPDLGLRALTFQLSLDRLQPGFVRIVRQTFLALPNITRLILRLPANTPPSIFTGVYFSELELVQSTLPHQTLQSFLARHAKTIVSLRLARCRQTASSDCPLRSLVDDFCNLTELVCDSECTRILLGSGDDPLPGLTYLWPWRRSTAVMSAETLVRGLTQKPSLHILVLHIYPDDTDIVKMVANFAPGLRQLKLIEKVFPAASADDGFNPEHQRPWQDTISWSHHLKLLCALESLILCCAQAPSQQPEPADEHAEQQFVMKLLTGSSSPAPVQDFHSSLREVALSYPVPCWTWECVWRCAGPGRRSDWSRVQCELADNGQM